MDFGWQVSVTKGDLITTLTDNKGNQFFYELGRHNIELSAAATSKDKVISSAMAFLDQLYACAKPCGAFAYHGPVLDTNEDLLVIPDERDATWLKLDGRTALASLARTSSVQFTFSVNPDDAIPLLNRLGWQAHLMLDDYPQDKIWRGYITKSRANYLSNRYGGPMFFDSLEDYCLNLVQHDVVSGPRLVPYADCPEINIPLFLRSIWWHFRLKRYNNDLCIEVRPMPRRSDDHIKQQFETLLGIVS